MIRFEKKGSNIETHTQKLSKQISVAITSFLPSFSLILCFHNDKSEVKGKQINVVAPCPTHAFVLTRLHTHTRVIDFSLLAGGNLVDIFL